MENKNYIEINGVKHFILEYTYDESLPVVLYVHGGPGVSETLLAYEIAGRCYDRLNWVFYDQRGAGRTLEDTPEGQVEFKDIENDFAAIVEYVYKKFNKKVYIMAHDFGTIFAMRYVRNNPDMVAGYIGYGQIIDMKKTAVIRCERVKALALRAGSKRDAKFIDKVGMITNGTFDTAMLKKKQVSKLNVLLPKYNVAAALNKFIMKRIPTSPIYDMNDLKHLMNGPRMSLELNEYRRQIDFFNEPVDYKVPILFISGDWDYQNPHPVISEYEGIMTAPYKEVKLLSDIGVNAMYEAPDEFWSSVLGFIEKAGEQQ